MIAPNLQEKFHDLGLDFHMASKDVKIRDRKNDIKFEIDIFLQINTIFPSTLILLYIYISFRI
jgi:hypothetical protein